MMPPMNFNLGSSATSKAEGGVLGNTQQGGLNEGDWITQWTENGDNTAVPSPKPVQPTPLASVAATGNVGMIALIAVVAWLALKK
ncbi:MAG: hypothetical protein V4563_15090 [Pseudomonadota bacterium]